jgi:hypothetical protein
VLIARSKSHTNCVQIKKLYKGPRPARAVQPVIDGWTNGWMDIVMAVFKHSTLKVEGKMKVNFGNV